MRLNRTIFALIALLVAPALACQTITGGLSPNSAATLEPELPDLGTAVPPDIQTAVPEGTISAIATSALGGEAPADIPVIEGSANLLASSQLVSYETTTSFDDTVKFYKDGMPANGWTEAQGSITFGDTSVMNYTKEGRTAVVTVSKSGDKTVVAIAIQ